MTRPARNSKKLLEVFYHDILLGFVFTRWLLFVESVDIFGDDISVAVFGLAEASELVI